MTNIINRYQNQNSIAELLIEFVQTNLGKDEFLTRESKLNSVTFSKSQLAIDLNDSDLKHEYCHSIEWAKREIRSNFYRNAQGDPFTVPNDEDFIKYAYDKKTTKEDLLKLYLDVATAPEKFSLSLDGSDLLYKNILLKRITSQEDIDQFRKNGVNYLLTSHKANYRK